MPPPRITAIIPALNESAHIGAAIRSCQAESIGEVVVVDGGSTDETCTVAQANGAGVITSIPPQRARQMNAGAASATGDFLVFLHADSTFESGAIASLLAAAEFTGVVGGGFRRRYATDSVTLKASCQLGNLRARHFGLFYGDQAIWVRRDTFQELGGFPEEPCYEDLDFSLRLRKAGRTVLLSPGIVTSARRFDGGVMRRLAEDVFLAARRLMRLTEN